MFFILDGCQRHLQYVLVLAPKRSILYAIRAAMGQTKMNDAGNIQKNIGMS